MKYRFNVPGMSCNHCKMRIEKALSERKGVARFTVDIPGKVVDVETDLEYSEIIALLDKTGYDATLVK
jgi:copper chaperone